MGGSCDSGAEPLVVCECFFYCYILQGSVLESRLGQWNKERTDAQAGTERLGSGELCLFCDGERRKVCQPSLMQEDENNPLQEPRGQARGTYKQAGVSVTTGQC